MIDVILFDFGGVFIESHLPPMRAAAAELGVELDLVMQVLFGPYHEDTNHPWHRLERGEIKLDEALREISALAAAQGMPDIFDVFERRFAGAGPQAQSAVVERTRALRAAGYRTALLTNNVAEFRPWWHGLLPLEELFELVVDSSEVGCRKPDPRFFELALQRLGAVVPSQCVFLDDLKSNAAAASALGMHAVVFEDQETALAQLDALLRQHGAPTKGS